MATRCFIQMLFITVLFSSTDAQDALYDAPSNGIPQVGVAWTAHDVSGIDHIKLRAMEDPSFISFDGHYSGTSAIGGSCASGQTIELWGEGDASYLGTSTISYAWCFDAFSGERVSIPAGEIISEEGQLHFMILEERPDVYHENMIHQRGTISYGTGDLESTSGAWDATMWIFKNRDGTFAWLMHIYGWLDLRAVM